MRYKLCGKIIDNGTYVLTRTELWLWCAKDSNWITRPISPLDFNKFIEIIKTQISKLSEKKDILDFDEIIEEYLKL